MAKTTFGIIGCGWRAQFYLRVATALPDLFEAAGVVARDEQKTRAFATDWNTTAFASPEQMIDKARPDFVVVSVPREAAPDILTSLGKSDMPILSEVPPAVDLDTLVALYGSLAKCNARVQFAEQYCFQPQLAAMGSFVETGRLGTISQAQISVAHGYHGISVMRKFLGIGFEDADVQGFAFDSPLVKGPTRGGPPTEEVIKTSKQTVLRFDFGDRLGMIDFTSDQYFSWIRGRRILIRGERGEILNDTATYLSDFATPICLPFVRHAGGIDGNLEGNYLKGIQAGEKWFWRNPFAPAPLTDDEIAIADCMAKMAEYVRTGKPFYSLAEACQDHYLALVAQEAVETGKTLNTSQQPWA